MLPGWKVTVLVWNGGMGGCLHDFCTIYNTYKRFYWGIYL
jgi:hypothetical protein